MGGLLPWLPLALQSHQAARVGAVSGFLAASSATRRTGPPVRRLLPLAGDAQTPVSLDQFSLPVPMGNAPFNDFLGWF